jgi:hypothetical protein
MKMKNSERQSVIEAPEMYEAPTVEVLEVEVEKGFAASGSGSPADPGDGGGAEANDWL